MPNREASLRFNATEKRWLPFGFTLHQGRGSLRKNTHPHVLHVLGAEGFPDQLNSKKWPRGSHTVALFCHFLGRGFPLPTGLPRGLTSEAHPADSGLLQGGWRQSPGGPKAGQRMEGTLYWEGIPKRPRHSDILLLKRVLPFAWMCSKGDTDMKPASGQAETVRRRKFAQTSCGTSLMDH